MRITVEEEPGIREIAVLIRCSSDDKTVQRIVAALNAVDRTLTCQQNGNIVQIGIEHILYIESVNRKTFIYTEQQMFETGKRLYELENCLKGLSFYRVSKAMIINLKRVRSLRPELGSRLLLTMDNGEKIMASRQYAGAVKTAIGVN